ncbi:MAG: DNA-protecting protein DprA [Candidatus Omnitrophica bacterium]|nr:DNA-protecting protein DprA [Candidatus Omnitrophota bacterium]
MDIWAAPVETLQALGLTDAMIRNIQHFPVEKFLQGEEDDARQHQASIVTIFDGEYPDILKTIPDAPNVLYVKGAWPKNLECAVAIVGSRDATMYGLNAAERLAEGLAERGIVVVSGLARGIDAAAHRGALRAGADTIAVLGCGLDVIYPPGSEELYAKISSQGCIVSEFPFGMRGFAGNFPRRNRIVSGLSLGVVVIEARIKSGALITAAFALEQGREVFAMPGRADSALSAGPHELIRHGAKIVLGVEDIFEELPLVSSSQEIASKIIEKRRENVSAEELPIVVLLNNGPLQIDEIALRSGITLTLLTARLFTLQIKRVIREKAGKVYELI